MTPFEIRLDRRADHLALHPLHLHRGPAATMNPATVPRTGIKTEVRDSTNHGVQTPRLGTEKKKKGEGCVERYIP